MDESDQGEEVFILGAGFNSAIQDEYGKHPPRSKNFFAQLFTSINFNQESLRIGNLDKIFQPILDEIKVHWHKRFKELKSEIHSIDLEESITYFEELAISYPDTISQQNLVFLKLLICYFLNQYARPVLLTMSKPIMAFASHVWQKKSPIITFNYDTLTEIALELASHNEWQRKYAYLIDFAGEVTPDNFDLNPINSKEGTNSMLKLHGSVNWFKFPNLSDLTEKSQGVKPFSRIPRDSDFSSLSTQLFFSPREDFLLLYNLIPNLLQMYQEFISPQIITPLLYKEKYSALDPFASLWEKAQNYLMQCQRLVIIGYGFPQNDLKIRELLSAVNTGGSIQEVLVVNPDKKVTKIVKKIFRKQKVTQCKNLAIYVTNFMNS